METIQFDHRDQLILEEIIPLREAIQGPRQGDFVRFPTGEIERFCHNWKDSQQTSPIWAGSFFLFGNGQASFSGSLNPAIPQDTIAPTDEMMEGSFWFFHHNASGAGRGVSFKIPCRVFETSATYRGFVSRL